MTTEDGEVCGVKVRGSDGKLKSVNGKKVMLSCGGFEGNREMLATLCWTKNRASGAHCTRFEVQHRPWLADGSRSWCSHCWIDERHALRTR